MYRRVIKATARIEYCLRSRFQLANSDESIISESNTKIENQDVKITEPISK